MGSQIEITVKVLADSYEDAIKQFPFLGSLKAGDTEESGASQTTSTPRRGGRPKKNADKPEESTSRQISSGQEREGPEDTPEDEAQDAADEAAETAAASSLMSDNAKLTHQDVLTMLGAYVNMYGLEAAQEDGVKIIGQTKYSQIPDTPADLAKAILAVGKALDQNTYKREPVGKLDETALNRLRPIIKRAQAVK